MIAQQTSDISAIVFDLGGVLVRVNKLAAQQALADRLALTTEAVDGYLFGSPEKERLDRGEITPQQRYEMLPGSVKQKVDVGEFQQIWCDIFDPIPESVRLLERLHVKFPLFLLSNTDTLHYARINRDYPFMKRFERHFLSFELGMLKPDPGIYELVAQSLPFECEELLLIDDRARNVSGAVVAGWQTILFTSPVELERDLQRIGLLG